MSKLEVVMLTTPRVYQSRTATIKDAYAEKPSIGFFTQDGRLNSRFWKGKLLFFRFRLVFSGAPLLVAPASLRLGLPGTALRLALPSPIGNPIPFPEEGPAALRLPVLDVGGDKCPLTMTGLETKSGGQEFDL